MTRLHFISVSYTKKLKKRKCFSKFEIDFKLQHKSEIKMQNLLSINVIF